MATLVVNIGNSNIRFGWFLADECQSSWVMNSKQNLSADEFKSQILSLYQAQNIDATLAKKIIIASVVPAHNRNIGQALEAIHALPLQWVDRNSPSQIRHSSKQMGTDIYANLVAAHQLYPKKCNVIVDFGTALTLSVVDADGLVQGVIIAPGIITSLNALVQKTAQLPQIEISAPQQLLGKDTETCMKSGIINGYVAMVEGLLAKIETELQQKCHCIATGGLSLIYAQHSQKIDVADQWHSLKGIYFLGNEPV
jgi:type III pantothenate kinase